MIKPYVLMTVYRKYFEMIVNIKRYQILKNEFTLPSSLVLIWGDPDPQDQWIFNTLLRNKQVDHILYRTKLHGDKHFPHTTYPESHNINLGLKFVKSLTKNNEQSYCLLQCHDIFVYQNTYREIDQHIQNGCNVVLCDWVKELAYATNFFAIRTNKEGEVFWPPVANNTETDYLERWWATRIGRNIPNSKIYTDCNHLFFHSHIYEDIEEWLRKFKITKKK